MEECFIEQGKTMRIGMILAGFLWVLCAQAENLTDVPDVLIPWKKWVLYGYEAKLCPQHYQKEDTFCIWPSKLVLNLDKDYGQFEQDVAVYHQGWIYFPGDNTYWPEQVTVNGHLVPVLDHQGLPALWVENGRYHIEGKWRWQTLPDSLLIPKETGLIQLTVFGQMVVPERFGNRVNLLPQNKKPTDNEALNLQVFRKIKDDIPLFMTTELRLQMSGEPREIRLPNSLLAGFIPLSLQSPLPAELLPSGELRLQAKPGRWVIKLYSRSKGPMAVIQMGAVTPPWPEEEYWAFEQNPKIRVVNLEGGAAVDPKLTFMPPEWQQFPTFKIKPTDKLYLKALTSQPTMNNHFSLNRECWLQFNGKGFIIQDHISGFAQFNTRLDMKAPYVLGRMTLKNDDQYITSVKEGRAGIDIPVGQLSLTAVSTLPMHSRMTTGWDTGFEHMSLTLHIPPGWRLFHAKGVDKVSNSWWQDWTLLDMFIAFLITICVYHLQGKKSAIIAGIALLLLFHERGAPIFIWLHVLFAMALFPLLPKGKIQRFMGWYRDLAFISLLIISAPFIAQQIQQTLFPQLEQGTFIPKTQRLTLAISPMNTLKLKETRNTYLSAIPNVFVPTGPGIPNWTWQDINLEWNGPISEQHLVRLFLIKPWQNGLLTLIRIAALCLLAWHLIRKAYPTLPKWPKHFLPIVLLSGLHFTSPDAYADIPSNQLLETYRERLLKPPACMPDCLTIANLKFKAEKEQAILQLTVHSDADLALPLPGKTQEWTPLSITLNQRKVPELLQIEEDATFIHLSPGVHQLEIIGRLPEQDSLRISWPWSPKILSAESQDYTFFIDPNRQFIELKRKALPNHTNDKHQQTILTPFLQLERELSFGIEWKLTSTLTRLTPATEPLTVSIPLLAAEKVISGDQMVKDNKIMIHLPETTTQVQWQSILAIQPHLSLSAAQTKLFTEVWRFSFNPLWHLDKTIPPNTTPGAWYPWPGDTLTLSLSKPKMLSAENMSIDKAAWLIQPGNEKTAHTLSFVVRSSRAGFQTIQLPKDAQIQSFLKDGQIQPIVGVGQITLPITPGTQSFQLLWENPDSMRTFMLSPTLALPLSSSNIDVTLAVPKDRWLLWSKGPSMGPAILFWGWLLVSIIAAGFIGYQLDTPLKVKDWCLLSAGLTVASPWSALLILGWFIILMQRRRYKIEDRLWFNLRQWLIVFMTVFSAYALFHAISKGLLGIPDIHLRNPFAMPFTPYLDNLSLNWYQDYANTTLPRIFVIAAPMMLYRSLMLLFAIWLSYRLPNWLKWGWRCFTEGGIWQSKT